MLTDYIAAAMRQAHYELMEDQRFFGSIPACQGCWAEGATLEECRGELQSTLEGWLLLGLQLGHQLPQRKHLELPGVDPLHSPRNQPHAHLKQSSACTGRRLQR